MPEPAFQYGPLARAILIALLWFTVLVGFFATEYLGYYLSFLLFLAVGLRPLLAKTGLYQRYSQANHVLGERRYRKLTAQRCAEAEAEKRAAKYKYRRYKDPTLPNHW